MSLARTALRLQAIEALNADPVIDAKVEGRIYDSRLGALDHREPMPTILVTTDTTRGAGWSANNGGAPFRTTCHLTLEIAQTAVAEAEGGGSVIGVVGTDRELEAQLDLLEHRAIEALTIGETPAAILLRRAVTRRITGYTSDRFPTDQSGEKLALRYVVFEVELKGDDGTDPRAVAIGDAYAGLPEPLRSVARAAPVGSSARAACDFLAAQFPAPDAAPRLLGADLLYAPQALDPTTPPNRAADAQAGDGIRNAFALPDGNP